MKQLGNTKNPESIQKMKNSPYHSGLIAHAPVVKYVLISPAGEVYELLSQKSLKEFCDSNQLAYATAIRQTVNGISRNSGSLAGWTGQKIRNTC